MLIPLLTFGGLIAEEASTINKNSGKKDIMLCLWGIPSGETVKVEFSPTGEDDSWQPCKFSDGSDMVVTSDGQFEFRAQSGVMRCDYSGDPIPDELKGTLL